MDQLQETLTDSTSIPFKVPTDFARSSFRNISDVERSNIAFRELQEKFRVLTEKAPVGIYHVNKDGKCLFVNQRWLEMTGLTQSELKDVSWLRQLKHGEKGNVFKLWQNAAKSGCEFTSEYHLLRFPNPNKWFMGVTVGLYDAKGNISGYLTSLVDISDAKKNQDELETNKERLEQAQTAGEIGIFDWDMLSDQLYWSPQQQLLFGLKPGSFSGKYDDWEKMIHPDDFTRVRKLHQKIIRSKTDSTNDEFRVIYPDGSVHWVMSRAKVYYNTKGKPVRMIGVNMDITEQRQTEQYRQFFIEASKILSSSLDYQSTLNSVARLAIPTFGDWCTIDLVKPSGEADLVAVAHRNVKKIKLVQLYRKKNPLNLSDSSNVFAQVIKTGKAVIYSEVTDDIFDAFIKDVSVTSIMIVPLRMKHKNIGVMSFFTDTHQRFYNDTDLEMAQELAERASLAIENAMLYASEQKAVQSRDEFLSIASHELKTPITVIKGFVQILQKRFKHNEDGLTLNLLQRSEVQVDRLTKLINELLDVTKIETGKMSFTYDIENLTRIVKEVVEDFRLTRPSHKIFIKGNSKQKALIDKERIRQVINNLLSNAIKYSIKSDTVIVSLSDKKNTVEVQVTDFGIGIEKQHLTKIFQRFFRANSIEGTLSSLGLGLYISSQIIKRHKGDIWVKSKIGKGSTFSFSLPIYKHK